MAEQESVSEQKHLTTRITRMEMKGFKSFAHKVDVPYGPDFNCILGPNGSGKSNVLDALCFVLGKAGSKGLRAEKTANLIYNGGKTKNPAKQGEVHIYFDNASGVFPVKEKEIKISRVVKQSGSSDYLINDETATRTQIVDLLSHARINPDGYNIILQGDIIRLVEMSPNERRGIIEEISGISIYEEKKAKAERELDRVDQQLKEAEIVLAERNTYLKELKKERDQALKFKELDDKLKRNKATVLVRKADERKSRIAELESKIEKEESGIAAVQERIDALKKEIVENKRGIDKVTREIEERGEKEQVALHREVEQLKVDLAVKKQRTEQLTQELSRIAERRKSLEENKKSTEQRVAQLEKDIAAAHKRIAAREKDRSRLEAKADALRKKHDLEGASGMDGRIQEIDSAADSLQQEIQSLREKQQELLRDKDRLEYQIQTIDERMAKVLEAQKENKTQLARLKAARSELAGVKRELDGKLDRSSAVVSELQTARGKLETREQELAKVRARQAAAQERTAAGRATQEILALRSKNKKIHGTVAELGRVSEQYSLALEIAAGGRLRSIVVEDDRTAQDCIAQLKRSRSGVATFLPLNKLSSRPIPAELRNLKQSGVHGLAIDLVSFDKRFEKAFQHALGSTLVVKDLDTARKVGIGRVRMVTLQGDLVETSGAMSGGYRARAKGVGFVEEEVAGRLAELEKEVADLQSVASRLSKEQESLTKDIEDLRSRRHKLEDEVASLERELHIDSDDVDASKGEKQSLKERAKALEKDIDAVVADVSAKNKELAKLKTEKHSLREKVTALRSPQLLAELNTFEQQKQKIGVEIAEIRTQADSLKGQIDSIHRPELENIDKILDQQEKERASFMKEQDTLGKELASLQKDLSVKEKKEAEFRKQFKGLFEERQKLQDEVTKREEKVIVEEDKVRKSEHARNASSIQLASLKAELAGIEEEAKEYEGVEPFKTKADADIQREIAQFERMVQEMGAVNMKALEMYERVESEYASLVEKKEVLGGEREDVLVMINEIDAKKRELFMRTFNAIEGHFKEIFLTLSRKGEAFLELEVPDDPFAGGLNIRVRLTGKKFMDIRSLSGGEKTMTALAFLFAIQEYEPASFYVLDEVDAALDKKNSERLAKLVRSYSDGAQYIMISHNDTIISEADTLFGVSMNEHGESQVTSLKL